MSFKLHITFSGLLHFVPNEDDSKKVQLCVALPNAPNHHARISAMPSGRLALKGTPVEEEISFDNMRVFFRVKRKDGASREGLDFQKVMLGGAVKGVIPFKDIAGDRAAEANPGVVSIGASAVDGVRAQILIEQGKFGLETPRGPARLRLPGTAKGTKRGEIKIAPLSSVTIDDVEQAQIVTIPLGSSAGQEVAYDVTSDGGEEAAVLLSYLCTNAIEAANSNDDDFRFHYRLLKPRLIAEGRGQAVAEEDPVPEIIELPQAVAESATAPTRGAFKSFAADTILSGNISALSLQTGGCNCAPAGGNSMAFDLDSLVTSAAPALDRAPSP